MAPFEYVPPTEASTTVTPSGGGDAHLARRRRQRYLPTRRRESKHQRHRAQSHGAAVGVCYVVDSFDLTATLSGSGAPVTTFAQPYTLILNYRPSAAKADTLALYYWDGAQRYEEKTAVVDDAHQQVTATPDHMTLFALMGKTERVYLPLVLR